MPASRGLLWAGVAAAAGGAVLCVLGWYGISGERFAERQLPYLASCTVPGAALIVAGAVLVGAAGRLPVRRPTPAAGTPEDTAPPSSDEPPVRVPGGTLAHRPDCPLVAGRADAEPAGDAELGACPVCEPWPR
ncbi:hypothetical protein M5362_29895 [Streptomyces sp. Je 1-79]|uniref:hypothetical protein n=1 Tax=Streptomyces sp. Je 1-79 TaxID=2943847 RepID=UPI0021A942D8|nr:hypothetical protein [Streptomyces sp. Je 1-79]MCT4357318.1 hypothetical protein [Streptomyces sp. Je 1-79]